MAGVEHQDPERIRARGGVPAGSSAGHGQGSRDRLRVLPDRPDGARVAAHRRARRAAAGRDHARQRLGEGQRRRLLPRDRPEEGGGRSRAVPLRDLAAGADDAARRPGQVELDDLLSKRERLNAELQQILDRHTDPWGVKVSMVEVKHVDLPAEMQRAIAKQAEAEREKRAKIIHAEGEFQASAQLAKAAEVISANPTTLQLRYLQTLTEIAAEKNSTIIFPVPIDFLDALKKKIV